VNDVLLRIVESTRRALADAPIDVERERARAEALVACSEKFSFSQAIADRRKGIRVIAEIKSASPSAGSIVENPDVEAIASAYRAGGAAAVSVVTESKFFRGDRAWLSRASAAAGLPVIMKDFIIDEAQLHRGVASGASAILLLASLLSGREIARYIALLDSYNRDALVEVHDEAELERAVEGGARLIGVNNRDLRNFEVDLATSERLGALIPAGVLKVSESGIRTHADVQRLDEAGFDAFLVGESLLRQEDRSAAVRSLTGAPV